MPSLNDELLELERHTSGDGVHELLRFAALHDQARQRRIDALLLMFGLWKGRTDIPSDGLAYHEELRRQD